ncbi:MAG: molybdenum cofactor biosynthesis protein B [Candidatus Methylomirabilales bacterium]
MGVEEHKRAAEKIGQISFAVITVSDSRSEAEDESGKYIQNRMREAGHRLVAYRVLKNDLGAIQHEVMQLVEAKVECVVTTGGTGLGRRDVTIEGVLPLLDKSLGGFGEIFRYLSFQEVESAALMSRAMAGTSRGTLIFCLPGSIKAVKLALERLILPELKHLIRELHR